MLECSTQSTSGKEYGKMPNMADLDTKLSILQILQQMRKMITQEDEMWPTLFERLLPRKEILSAVSLVG